jgi:hypothetical protein
MFRNTGMTGFQRLGWIRLGGLLGMLSGCLGEGRASAPAPTRAAPAPPPSRRGGAWTSAARAR